MYGFLGENSVTVWQQIGALIIAIEGFIVSKNKIYHLMGPDGKTYESDVPEALGGHRKLKIYGRLDCPSALRYIAKGQYVQYRVFFKDEDTAIAAGYRPCGICMKEEYKRWKAQRS